MKKIMVLNLGSTSFKFKLFAMDQEQLPLSLVVGSVDAIASPQSKMKLVAGETIQATVQCRSHRHAFELCMAKLKELRVLKDLSELDAVGYKAVHAGGIDGPQFVTQELIDRMSDFSALAPAHNPIYIDMMQAMRKAYPDIKQIACFETAFHATIPLKRAVYGIPKAWIQWGVRRYGFHGSSHSYVAKTMQEKTEPCRRVICAHLGGSSSICAILDGNSIANSMGATPQSGLFHNDRVGDFDAFCLPLLAKRLGGLDAALDALSRQSGLLGLSGLSNDMRIIEQEYEAGNADAALALDAYCDNITGYIGMYTAYLGGLDAIVFTGGIGEHSPIIREKALAPLGYLGVKTDPCLNHKDAPIVSATDSRVKIYVMETNEELMVAHGAFNCLVKQ